MGKAYSRAKIARAIRDIERIGYVALLPRLPARRPPGGLSHSLRDGGPLPSGQLKAALRASIHALHEYCADTE